MDSLNHMHTAPVTYPRTRRNHGVAVLTSLPAGKCVPLVAIPLLREDGMRASMRVAVEMLETVELLMNPVNLRITAYLVPFLALERFEGSRDQFDRSFMGQPKVEGGAVVPFIETQAMGTHGSNAVYKALGLHAQPTDQVNTAYLEAYNQIWNFRAKNRSKNLAQRTRLQTDLAPAFWQHSRFEHVVPDFDQAVIDGEISLNIVSGQMAVKAGGGTRLNIKGVGFDSGTGPGYLPAGSTVRTSDGTSETSVATVGQRWTHPGASNNMAIVKERTVGGNAHPDVYADLTNVYAEMAAGGVSVSLSNLELARKTTAFAKLRERYDGFDDEYIIDMLMDGLSIPDQALKQPILLSDQTVRFAQAKRYAMDAGNLAESAVSGGAFANVNLRVPRLETGGIVMVIAECVPEQLFERQRDPFFFAGNTRDDGELVDLPAALRDSLDPEKVDIVKNGEIDTAHATPNGTFGYAPMNWKWNAWGPRVGGKFLRPTTDAGTDNERQRIWAVEKINPALSADFYIVSAMHQKPFLDLVSDPFEASVIGNAVIDGNTQFGGVLIESAENYDEVLEKAPQTRIAK